jgi:hypothetical protein
MSRFARERAPSNHGQEAWGGGPTACPDSVAHIVFVLEMPQ